MTIHPSLRVFQNASVMMLAASLMLSSCATVQQSQDEDGKPDTTVKVESPTIDQIAQTEAAPPNRTQPGKPINAPTGAIAESKRRATGGERDESFADGQVKDKMPQDPQHNTEDYNRITDNPFLESLKNPLSTFSIDVDTASYSNMRRFIESKQLPPADAVRIEELVNYFPYAYPTPSGEHPFSVTTNLAECPWTPGNKLLRIGLRGKPVNLQTLPPQNLVFLLDVSGSMDEPNKLPLLKRSLKMVVDQMREQDFVSIVVYAGAAGLVLPPTNGTQREKILDALENLQAGGSTAGSAGIQLAYETAKKHYRSNANNRVIMATDGDFNVGPSSDGELIRMIEEKRNAGIYLTVLGYGMGNYKDNKLEQLADKGNGNHAYIDSLAEARKVLVEELGGTLQTIAKDVKLQLEFNPAKVASYRLIGYENRLLAAEDFDNDAKDAGELGAGTSVTALYELVPAKGKGQGHDLRYQTQTVRPEATTSNEMLSVKLRYKPPTSDTSKLLAQTVSDQALSWSSVPADFRFAASVANFGMQLRKSEHKGKWQLEDTIAQARQGLGDDKEGYRKSFIALATQTQELMKK